VLLFTVRALSAKQPSVSVDIVLPLPPPTHASPLCLWSSGVMSCPLFIRG
jgi:hypothetical protein